MPLSNLGQLHIGKVDGKHEFIDHPSFGPHFYDAFLVPPTININEFLNGHKYIVRGFRGTGKTSLLRYMAKRLRDKGAEGQFVLFKTGLSETHRMEISRQAGISWEEVDSKKIEVLQDFKDAWKWFLHKKIGEMILANNELAGNEEARRTYLELLGLTDKAWFERVFGGFPKIEATRIKLKAKVPALEAQVQGTVKSDPKAPGTVLFAEVVYALDNLLPRLSLRKTLYVYVDELEVFFQTPEQYRRDLRMVRDMIFAVDHMVELTSSKGIGILFCAAVRTEILDALGSEGQEVSRIAQDRGVHIAWHYASRNLHHPLFEMIRLKIWASETLGGLRRTPDPISQYFPERVMGLRLDAFLLDQSFYKPRDLIWRLALAQQQFAHKPKFDEYMFKSTEMDYSSRLWEEIVYELGAIYSSDEVSIIEALFLGQPVSFYLGKVLWKFDQMCIQNQAAVRLRERRGEKVILQDLYRLGAIGNVFRVGTHSADIRHRWIFRGESTLVLDKQMELHHALIKRLSAVRPKYRAASRRGGGKNRREAQATESASSPAPDKPND